MHLGIPALLKFYRQHCEEESLVLATIVATNGSTYRKPGAMMLISRDGSFEGMISGGCLEGDLLHHAAEVFHSRAARFVTYDMHADEELVWNLGLGCDGVNHLMLQRLDKEDDYGFLKQLDSAHGARNAVVLALVTQPGGNIPAGTSALLDSGDALTGHPVLQELLRTACSDWPQWRSIKLCLSGDPLSEVMLIHMPPRTRILICGAGPDALPVVRVFSELDWDIVVVDHRPVFAKAERFSGKCTVVQTRPENLGQAVDLNDFDAVIIMSHHLENDSAYLGQVSSLDIEYIGVLGPRARRNRLCEMADTGKRVVYGPVGLDIGAELPESIALSVAAEIHAVLNHRDGISLTRRIHEAR